MAKKAVATFAAKAGAKSMVKCIRMEKSPKTGSSSSRPKRPRIISPARNNFLLYSDKAGLVTGFFLSCPRHPCCHARLDRASNFKIYL